MNELQNTTANSNQRSTFSSFLTKTQPIRILCGFLVVLAIAASFSWSGASLAGWFIHPRDFALLWLSGWLTYKVLLYFSFIKPTRIEHRIITTTILYLLFDPLLAWWVFLLVGLVTEIAQRFIRSVTGPIFNPAAFGALMLAILGSYPGWWGMSFAPRLPIIQGGISVAVLLTASVAGYVAYKYKKLTTVFSMLTVFSFVYFLMMQHSPLFLLLEGTLLFFVLVMVIEPKTSPMLRNEQLIFGATVGALIPALLRIGFYEAYVGALLIANLGWYYKRFWHQKVLQKVFVNGNSELEK